MKIICAFQFKSRETRATLYPAYVLVLDDSGFWRNYFLFACLLSRDGLQRKDGSRLLYVYYVTQSLNSDSVTQQELIEAHNFVTGANMRDVPYVSVDESDATTVYKWTETGETSFYIQPEINATLMAYGSAFAVIETSRTGTELHFFTRMTASQLADVFESLRENGK